MNDTATVSWGLNGLATESRHPDSHTLDCLSVADALQLMHREDRYAVTAVGAVLPIIEQVVARVGERLSLGGRLIYVGAGTSGRLGVLDAVECVPTFSVSAQQVVGLMAGGMSALFTAVEGAEDNNEQGALDVLALRLTQYDTVIGIAASGRTPYVMGAITAAKQAGALTVGLSANAHSQIGQLADWAIDVETGAEVLTGSTRLKAATAHKLVLNMISTLSMRYLHKIYENLMIDVAVTNHKLHVRAVRMLMTLSGVAFEQADQALQACQRRVPLALIVLHRGCSVAQAAALLTQYNGDVRAALNHLDRDHSQTELTRCS